MATRREPLPRVIDVGEIAWRDIEPGVRIKPLWSDRATGRFLFVGRVDAGVRLRHRHVGDELAVVLEGATSDEWTLATPGTLCYRPDGCAHTETTAYGVTNLALATGTVEPTDDVPAGPPSEVVALHEIAWESPQSGVLCKRVWEHPRGGLRLTLLRFEPGTTFPAHEDDADELCFVSEGAIGLGSAEARAGSVVYRPPGCEDAIATNNGATVLRFESAAPNSRQTG